MSELWRRLVVTAAVGGLSAGLVACGEPDDHAPHTGGPTPKSMVLRVATTDSVSSLDPAGPYDVSSRTVQANLYQTLLTILPGKPTPVPDAADCQFDSPTTYTCSLKEGLTFPNGHELTSSDVRFSFDRMLAMKTPGGPAPLFASVTSVSTPDELTAVFNLKAPDARLPYLLTTTGASIVDEESYPVSKLVTTTAVGSGPYQLTAYKPGESLTLARFAAYKGSRGAQNDGVQISLVKDAVALNHAITRGQADVAYRGFTIGQLDKLRTSNKVQVVESEDAVIQFVAFQLKSVTARRLPVRRAIAQLIDRPALVKKAYAEHVSPLYSMVPSTVGGATDAFRSEYKQPNKAAAVAILKAGGVKGVVPLTLGWTPSRFGPGSKAEALELKRQLDASGLFRVTLRSADWPEYQQQIRAGAFDLYIAGWIPEYPDADNYLAPFVGVSDPFPNGYRSAAATKLLQQERVEQNGITRAELLGQLQDVFAREVPVLPTWQGRLSVVAGTDVQNVSGALDPLAFLHLSGLRK
ncbi:ABC transporter substrate-binding protein [Kribbella antibiotica]|uniref:ABC transporter substrate-binding protein n=1 Tax=Kribbella antibiotica TaxID=190195 RepID=A0A4R4ZIU1_9ACTN|nr:ABC transporter substrate-binding protein [Kribbella antibiotica]TDD58641.1 ABC transporter substrate-binding protein [Kribbella antibiotica]